MNRTMRKRKGGKITPLQIGLLIGGAAMLLMIIAGVIWLASRSSGNQLQTVTAVFTRTITDPKDEGRAMPSEQVTLTSSTAPASLLIAHLGDVCSSDQLSHYGGMDSSAKGPFFVGVQVKLLVKSGNRLIQDLSPAPLAPSKDGDMQNPVRTDQAKVWCDAFNAKVAEFTKALPVHRVYALMIDTTGGITRPLADRVREIMTRSCAEASGEVYLYDLADTAYQGGRQHFSCGDSAAATALDTLLARTANERSSIYGGMHEAFGEVRDLVKQDPYTIVNVQVFTDGVQNTPDEDLYHHTELLHQPHPGVLESTLGLGGMDLSGIQVDLHPVPDEKHAQLVTDAISFLRDQLKASGASVELKTF